MVKMINDHLVEEEKPEDYDPTEDMSECSHGHQCKLDCIMNQCPTVFDQNLVGWAWQIDVICNPEGWGRGLYWFEFFRCQEIAEQMEWDLNALQRKAEYD